MGHEPKWRNAGAMSALPLETDVPLSLVNVGLGPEADVRGPDTVA
jgi:hypothetical protein